MSDSPAKRKRILHEAAQLFIEHGFGGTTLAMIAKRSGSAVGSITHFFGDKAQLAAAVHKEVAASLTTLIETALRGHGTDVAKAIRALISACLAWAKERPGDARLIAVLEAAFVTHEKVHISAIAERLGWVLAGWARQLQVKRIERLSPGQLYAVVLAPTMFAVTSSTRLQSEVAKGGPRWLTVLTDAARGALTP